MDTERQTKRGLGFFHSSTVPDTLRVLTFLRGGTSQEASSTRDVPEEPTWHWIGGNWQSRRAGFLGLQPGFGGSCVIGHVPPGSDIRLVDPDSPSLPEVSLIQASSAPAVLKTWLRYPQNRKHGKRPDGLMPTACPAELFRAHSSELERPAPAIDCTERPEADMACTDLINIILAYTEQSSTVIGFTEMG
ncbi:hypothetical protein SKAU_G00388400 [Synaphobranchus kaupii]|uniref:Uncharacterized protein n=1 Tax=Synaphobranchus kaupii TaxID=118154 RepID=A0A9Q1EAX5_SYNKA|nr:hypothetical protein SKAU_G00388400 [Synaphobranchus kaupii]